MKPDWMGGDKLDLDAIEQRADKGWVRPEDMKALVQRVRELEADKDVWNGRALVEARRQVRELEAALEECKKHPGGNREP